MYSADIAVCQAQIPGNKKGYNSKGVQCWDRDEAINLFLEYKQLNGVLWNKLIKKDMFDKIDFDKSLWYWEDLQVVWKLLQKAKRVVKINQAKYNFLYILKVYVQVPIIQNVITRVEKYGIV